MLPVNWEQPKTWLKQTENWSILKLSQAERLLITITVVATSSLIALMEYTQFCERLYDYFMEDNKPSDFKASSSTAHTAEKAFDNSNKNFRWSRSLFSWNVSDPLPSEVIPVEKLPPINPEDLPDSSQKVSVSPENVTGNLCWALTAINIVNANGTLDSMLFPKPNNTSQALVTTGPDSLDKLNQGALQLFSQADKSHQKAIFIEQRKFWAEACLKEIEQEETELTQLTNLPEGVALGDDNETLKKLISKKTTLEGLITKNEGIIQDKEQRVKNPKNETDIKNSGKYQQILNELRRQTLPDLRRKLERLNKLINVLKTNRSTANLLEAIEGQKEELKKEKEEHNNTLKKENGAEELREQNFKKAQDAKRIAKERSKEYITKLISVRQQSPSSKDLTYIQNMRLYLFSLFKEMRNSSKDNLEQRQEDVNSYFAGFLKNFRSLIKEFPEKYFVKIEPEKIGREFLESKELIEFIYKHLLIEPTRHGHAIDESFKDVLIHHTLEIKKPLLEKDPLTKTWEYSLFCTEPTEAVEEIDIGQQIIERLKDDSQHSPEDKDLVFERLPKKLTVHLERKYHSSISLASTPIPIKQNFTLTLTLPDGKTEKKTYELIGGDVHIPKAHYFYVQKTQNGWQSINNGQLSDTTNERMLKEGSVYLFKQVN